MTGSSGSCLLCAAATDHGGPWLGLERVCPRCRSGQVAPALERWGLTLTDAPVDAKQPWDWLVRAERPTALAAAARLSLEQLSHKARKLLGSRDPEVGDERFDDQVWVEADEGALRLLEQPGVRATILALLRVPAVRDVAIGAVEVTVRLVPPTGLAERLVQDVLQQPLEQARHLAVVLAVQLERRARDHAASP